MDNENIISVSKNILSDLQTNDFCDKHPDKVRAIDLNNFFSRAIPEGFTRGHSDIVLKDGRNMMQMTLLESYHKVPYAELLRRGFSEKRINQTCEDFYRDIDVRMNETNIDKDEVQRLYQGILRMRGDNVQAIIFLHEKLMPLYHALRKQGYSHYDLVV